MEQDAVPEAALTSLGSIFWRLGGGEKPSRSSYAAETVLFSQVCCSEKRQNDFHGVLGPPINLNPRVFFSMFDFLTFDF